MKNYAVAVVHTWTGEYAHSPFKYTYEEASKLCIELQGRSRTMLHFPIKEGEDIKTKAMERVKYAL